MGWWTQFFMYACAKCAGDERISGKKKKVHFEQTYTENLSNNDENMQKKRTEESI